MRDVESGALVWCPPRGNGAVVVVYEDGLTVTRHADGTVQRWRQRAQGGLQATSGLVLVECPGFASVEASLVSGGEQNRSSFHRKTAHFCSGGNPSVLGDISPDSRPWLKISRFFRGLY